MSFSSLGLSAPILKAVAAQGYQTPSPIQAQAIPAVLTGRDVMAAAQTGTGKTAGFTLPLLERLKDGRRPAAGEVRALILTPTRELAAQISDNVTAYSANLKLRSTVVFGGVSINPQLAALKRGMDILVATPGRLLDLHAQKAVSFDKLEVLVLDEADRMLDMGFIHDIRRILKLLPAKRQNLMFSATFSDDIRALAKGLVNDPVEISVTPRNTTAQTVSQTICPVDKSQKSALLTHLINQHNWQQVLVFSRTKHGANRLAKYLDGKGITAAAIHGNKSQNARTAALANFKSGAVRVMVATDIAARGLDIDQLPQVVNFDLPNVPEDYVHRIGRTGRAGASGHAVSLVSDDESKQLRDIERLIGRRIERQMTTGFEPSKTLPQTELSSPNNHGRNQRQPASKENGKNPRRPQQRDHQAANRHGRKADDRVLAAVMDEPTAPRRNSKDGQDNRSRHANGQQPSRRRSHNSAAGNEQSNNQARSRAPQRSAHTNGNKVDDKGANHKRANSQRHGQQAGTQQRTHADSQRGERANDRRSDGQAKTSRNHHGDNSQHRNRRRSPSSSAKMQTPQA